ncbi:MAG: hypothetical protein KME18_18165 [Phormidium tanganyikae FI6-MK23]|jgi:hypothetical protein|nr:hypothetical protein [Phormidium tanganyikae FI6-MK23]
MTDFDIISQATVQSAINGNPISLNFLQSVINEFPRSDSETNLLKNALTLADAASMLILQQATKIALLTARNNPRNAA